MPNFRRYYAGSTVSRDLDPGNYAWDSVVYQSGRPVLDAEVNLPQDNGAYNRTLATARTTPSGFFLPPGVVGNTSTEFTFPTAATGHENRFYLGTQFAVVAGMPVVVDFTNSSVQGVNEIRVPTPTPFAGAGTANRTDFVFLEVWRAQVAPSPRATGSVTVNSPQTLANGDTVTVNATGVGGPSVTFTARTAPATATEFAIGGSATTTAASFATVVNNPTNGLYPTYVAGRTNNTNTVTLTAIGGGAVGNTIALSTSAAGHVTLSGPTFTGGANTGNRPTQSTIYRLGNVQSPTGVALPDDLVDPVLNVETARRVQVQYRFRVFSSQVGGVNPMTQPDGFSNGGVLAQGATGAPVATYPFVKADGVSVSGSSDASAYGFLDQGLYVAGNGSSGSATALGTADGFVYAIPVGMVFRRNDATLTGGFDPFGNASGALPVGHANNYSNTNLPGGPYAIPTGKSDRPDGAFADIVVPTDLLDLRRHVSAVGLDYMAVLRTMTQTLLDKSLNTWAVKGSDLGMVGNGTGDISTYPLVCDEVGRTAASGGVAPTSGTTTVGNTVRNFDHIARRFASQSVVEKVVFEVSPLGSYPTGISVVKSGGTSGWHEDDTITIDFATLNPTTLQTWLTPDVPGVGVSDLWPVGTMVTAVGDLYHDDGHNGAPVDQRLVPKTVTGIGTTKVDIVLDANNSVVNGGGTVSNHPLVDTGVTDTGSQRRVFVELEVTYPTGAGLTRTPDRVLTPDSGSGYGSFDLGPVVENDPTQRPAEMATTWTPSPRFREGFREVALEQRTAPSGTYITDTLVSRNATTVVPPRRVATATGLTVNGVASTAVYGSSGRVVTLGTPVVNQTAVVVHYYSQDPVPNAGTGGYQVGVYYRTQAPQTVGVQSGGVPTTLLPTQLTVEPLCALGDVFTGQTGKGSATLGYPYASPLDQIAVATDHPVGSTPKEWYFSGLADISLSDFDSPTGLLSLHGFVQVDTSGPLTLGSTTVGRGTEIDAEFRVYYDYANHGGYKPTAMAQPLVGATRHKTFTTLLVRSTVDTLAFRKGEVLLLVLSQYHELGPRNTLALTDTPSVRTSAALYRTRNLLTTAV